MSPPSAERTPRWPTITEPLLRERLAMDDERFTRFFLQEILPSVGRRRFTRELYERGIGYPWERPESSFVLRGAEVLPPTPPVDAAARHPLLAIGSNGSPQTLARKLAHLADTDRELLVLAGELHDFDIGVAAHPTAYGSMPANLFESPGTAVRAAILWVTDAQLTQLAWTELTYRLGRLDGIRFVADDGTEVRSALVYVSRFGTFCPDGGPVALAAMPARDRTAPALDQPSLLDAAARLALGPEARGTDLVRRVFEDVAGFATTHGGAVRARGRPLRSPAWTPWRP